MTDQLRSDLAAGTSRWAVRRAEWRSLGITDEEMARPKIAIVNSSSDLAACFAHLDGIVPVLKDAIRAAGGLPFEIRTAAPADFVTSAGSGGRYVLPSRDLIVNDIEVVVEGALLDGMVCLSSCDKTAPAHMMAAGRMNVPAVLVACGYQHSALAADGGPDIEEVFLRAGRTALGRGSAEDLREMSEGAIRGPGVCAGMGTANTMHMAAEALGMALPGTTPTRANGDTMWKAVRDAGKRIVEMVHTGQSARTILTPGAIRNAVTLMLAVGGSINSVKHLQAIAVEAGLDTDVWRLYEELADRVPVLTAVRPNGPHLIEQLDDIGGAHAVLSTLAPLLDLGTVGVSGRPLGEVLAGTPEPDREIVRPLADPFTRRPSIVIVRGSLAADGAIVKLPVDEERPATFRGPARCYSSRETAIAGLAAGKVQAGEVVVLRGMGLHGGPGMAMVSAFVFALDGAGLGEKVAVVTDGQLSGLVNKGIVVGEVSPEAAIGGPLGRVVDGDMISIDLTTRTVDLEVDPEVLAAREIAPAETDRSPGWLATYDRTVTPLACGAVLGGRASGARCRSGKGGA
ncbi:dihydroxy-acid dehydratase [Amycolatopsis alkalitolerans]|uniref:Dihydroxy-acid dehydratase n=1 Tax=Amycolatopsis alkalitolerans TaxID=2547244 RepID=A0A5C4LYZ1_9PSEU|nr:dihydroxy-acid dehydratase [Amycolatopsis alkalitolerans]TNC25066.1 dihydroxy-acid dehydratase [Amycolatopsis alkalitolerans]